MREVSELKCLRWDNLYFLIISKKGQRWKWNEDQEPWITIVELCLKFMFTSLLIFKKRIQMPQHSAYLEWSCRTAGNKGNFWALKWSTSQTNYSKSPVLGEKADKSHQGTLIHFPWFTKFMMSNQRILFPFPIFPTIQSLKVQQNRMKICILWFYKTGTNYIIFSCIKNYRPKLNEINQNCKCKLK